MRHTGMGVDAALPGVVDSVLSSMPTALDMGRTEISTLLIQFGHALQVCEVQTLRPEGVQGQPARGVPHLHLAGG
jgi:hypothetical protein